MRILPQKLLIFRISFSYKSEDFDLSRVDYDTDVLIIGGGGGGAGAALLARENGAKVMIATKLRIGDSNSMMSQGGIQASVNPNDSPALHYLDVLGVDTLITNPIW